MMGRVTNSSDSEPNVQPSSAPHGELLAPMGDEGGDIINPHGEDIGVNPTPVPGSQQGVFDTNTMKESAAPVTYTQEDIDYAIASRYVELEREYSKNKPVGKDTAKEISYIVMDDFELTPKEWESFLSRATASDLFNKVRAEQPE